LILPLLIRKFSLLQFDQFCGDLTKAFFLKKRLEKIEIMADYIKSGTIQGFWIKQKYKKV
jgi:hypothetical protein